MSDYDSILKEKKKKKEVVVKSEEPKVKKFPTLLLSIISVILVLIISYVVYYNTILEKSNIVINDLKYLKESYQTIFSKLYIDNFKKDNLDGKIILNDNSTYSFIKENDNYYLKVPSIDKYINKNVVVNNRVDVSTFLKEIDKDRYIKTFYLDGKVPIVEVNLILERVELERILGRKIINEYEAIITVQNHAFSNEILNIKIVLNDRITSTRKVITIENNTIYYKDDNNNLKFNVLIKNDDFTIKVYKDDILYSVLNGMENVNTYDYSYQIIDKLYTLKLKTRLEYGNPIYEFTSSIDGIISTMNLELMTNSNKLSEMVNYVDLIEEEKKIYVNEKNILLDFINKYKNNI